MASPLVQGESRSPDVDVASGLPDSSIAPTPVRWHSVSSTREYERCPRRYRYAYIERLPQDRHVPIPWRIGSAVHAGLEAAYRIRQEDSTLPLATGIPHALAALRRSWETLELPWDERCGRAARQVVRSLREDVLQVGEVVGVELALRDELSPGHRIAGFLDLLLRRDPSTVEIIDHKVTWQRATTVDVASDFQLNLYGALVKVRWPTTHTIRATLHYPTGPDRVTATLFDEGMAAAHARVERTAGQAASDTSFVPIPGEHCDHCPWRPRCPAG
jgi:putative RecB family exonuclease